LCTLIMLLQSRAQKQLCALIIRRMKARSLPAVPQEWIFELWQHHRSDISPLLLLPSQECRRGSPKDQGPAVRYDHTKHESERSGREPLCALTTVTNRMVPRRYYIVLLEGTTTNTSMKRNTHNSTNQTIEPARGSPNWYGR
jgi:hypothetical protein